MSHSQVGFVVVLPAKPLARAKSRLAALGSGARVVLAEAFLADTLTAVQRCPAVLGTVVVTDDVDLARRVTAPRVHCVPDGHGADLNATLSQAAAEAARLFPTATLVALCSDLPALRSEDLQAVLTLVPERGPCFVSDAELLGTTLYAAPTWAGFKPAFGPDSRLEHRGLGALELTEYAGASLRRDVDTPEDLAVARRLGMGPATRAALEQHRL